MWKPLSPALPGRTHDLTAARTHRIIRICERQGVPILLRAFYRMNLLKSSSFTTSSSRWRT
jgi:hypothetical protein